MAISGVQQRNPALQESAALALESSLHELVNGTCAQGHCNFYTCM
jgi:hypothetical protein